MKDKEVYGKLKISINVEGIKQKIKDRIMRKLNRGFGIDENYMWDMDEEIIVEKEDYFNIDELRDLKEYLSNIGRMLNIVMITMDFYLIEKPNISYVFNNMFGKPKETYKEGVRK